MNLFDTLTDGIDLVLLTSEEQEVTMDIDCSYDENERSFLVSFDIPELNYSRSLSFTVVEFMKLIVMFPSGPEEREMWGPEVVDSITDCLHDGWLKYLSTGN